MSNAHPVSEKAPVRESNGSSELTLANQWIEYLKRRSRNATILWVFFLLLASVGISAAIYNYLSVFELRIAMKDERQRLDALVSESEDRLSDLKLSFDQFKLQSESDLTEAKQESEQLKATMSELNQLKGQAGDQLELSAKLVAALKAKVANLEDERSLLEDALVKSRQDYDALVSSQQVSEAMIKEQQEALGNRTSAYQALVNRLKNMEEDLTAQGDEKDRLSTQLSQAKANQNSLLKELASFTEQNDQLKKERDALQTKLTNLTQPVIASPKQAVAAVPSSGPVTNPKIIREPIVSAPPAASSPSDQSKPVKKANPVSSELSFDSIAID